MIANHQDDRREMQARHAQEWHDLLTQQHREQLQQGTAATDLHQGQRAALMTNQSDEIGALIGSQNRDRGLIAQRHEQMRKEERNPPRPRQQPRPAPAPAPAPAPSASGETRNVSSALEVSSGGRIKAVVDRTLAAIDAVHTDGDLPNIPINATRGRRTVGQYRVMRSITGHGTPDSISCNPHTDHPHMTLAHEIGHFLDHQAMQRPDEFGSERDPDFHEFLDAVKETNALQTIRGLMGKSRVSAPDGRQYEMSSKHVRYLLENREVWARAYAQYIAIRSGDPRLLAELNADRKQFGPNFPRQWDDADFEPVAAAIDRLLEKKGWK
jgi:hypothetical protein